MDSRGLAPLAGILVVALVVAPVATVAVSQAAIPGEALYGIKRASEVITAPSALDKLDRRIGELEALLERNPDPALIRQTLVDVQVTVDAVVAEADSAEGIERAKAALSEAETRLMALLDDPNMPEEAKFGLQTALDAIDSGQVGLDTAMDQLESLPDGDSRPDVAP
jgi:uncharacterized iron-regulated membrane protein